MKTTNNILNFAIVGAPKCGTTSLFHSLNERDEISFLGKDSHLLGKDLDLLLRDHSININQVMDHHPSDSLIGDVSVWYLYSASAAEEIFELNNKAKIIICLRNPLELIPSLHNQHVKGGDESDPALNSALTNDFRSGPVSTGVHFRQRPRYADVINFGEQISRYTRLFDQVLFIFHEDLRSNYKGAVQKIEAFLGLTQRDNIAELNQNKRQKVTNASLVKVLKKKPAFLKSVFRAVVPSKKIRHKLMETAMNKALTEDIDPTSNELTEENRKVICKLIEKQLPLLEELTGRDCSNWLKEPHD